MISRTFTAHLPLFKEALQGQYKESWKEAIKKISTLVEVKCWQIVERPKNQKLMYTKFALKIKCDEKEETCKHKAHLVVCGNEEVNCQEEIFSPVAHYHVIKLMLSLCM